MTGVLRKLACGIFLTLGVVWIVAGAAQAADRARVEAFLKVTGFDVAIDSIALSAESAPDMLGVDSGAFGYEWRRTAEQVFDVALMRARALDILEATLEDDLLDHAAAFYASDLGMRLVAAENDSHFADDTLKQDEGRALVAEMVQGASARIEAFRRMNHAIDPNDIGPKAIQEIQIRFILAASYAGVIELRVDEAQLRAVLAENEGALRRDMAASALANAAYTYQDFTDEEVAAYADALEHPDMQVVYELMNAVHFDVMMNRFEALATKLGQVQPSQEL